MLLNLRLTTIVSFDTIVLLWNTRRRFELPRVVCA